MPYHELSFSEAIDLVTNFVQDTNMQNVAANYGLGGLISVQNFYQAKSPAPGLYAGTNNWFCLRNTQGSKSLFLAIEKAVDYDPAAPPAAPASSPLYYNKCFTYRGGTDHNTIQTFLTNHTTSLQPDTSISQSDVVNLSCSNFVNNLPGNMPGYVYRQYSCAFFSDNDQSILSFLAQVPGVQYLHYYYGLEIISESMKNIVVIFFPVDAAGTNITVYAGNNVLMLERNYPRRP
ncbi:MAG: hypothetical protein JNM00_12495 [Flavobacteriales bacterium]|nr:hypothetical protein [Flavobacteriales bacterium]